MVDDDRDFADSLARLLELEGYRAETAYDARAARRAAGRSEVDVALIDIRLGETNGLDLIGEFQERYPEITSIMITAYASVDTVISALQRGAYDYLCKPFYTEDLLATLERCFERISLRREHEKARQQLHRRNTQLEAVNRRLREIIDNSPSLITMRNLDGRFVMANRRFEEWHGMSRARAEGKASHELFAPELAGVYAITNENELRKGRVVEDEVDIAFPDGRTHTVLLTNFPVLDADGQLMGVGTIGTDMTDRRHAEDELRQAQKMEALGQLTGGIAHDFNNLLAVISGNLSLLRDESFVSDDRNELIEDALASAKSGAELTHRLLAFGRRQTLHPQVIDTRELMSGLLRILERTLGETIEIERSLPDDLWPIEIDSGQFETALLNLALNARDAMPEGGRLGVETSNITLDRSMALADGQVPPGDYVKITVSDTGAGMTGDVMERAVQPFFTTKDAKHGSGLGLSMVYGFAKQSGGYFALTSSPGAGTSATLYLPRTHAAIDRVLGDGEDAGKPAYKGERILLVEDDSRVRRMARRILRALGYDVLEAEDGEVALTLLKATPDIDLLFTDIVLPRELNGFELAAAARQISPDLQVLYTSGYAEDPLLRGRNTVDPIRLVRKPFLKEDLAREVGLALGHAENERLS
ncbi:MAG: response regulator [Hyphomicrobiales bacterium]